MAHRRLAAPLSVALLVVLWIGGAGAPASAAAPTPVPPGGTPQAEPRMPGGVVYTLPGMGQVPVRKNLTYKTVGDAELKLDVYSPPGLQAGNRRPAVLLGHGRGGKDSAPWVSWGRLLAASGYVAVVFNYRDPGGTFPSADILGDIDDLLGYVRANAGALQVDGDRLGIWCASALVRHHVSAVLRHRTGAVRAVVAYYGWLDDTDRPLSPLAYLRDEPDPTGT